MEASGSHPGILRADQQECRQKTADFMEVVLKTKPVRKSVKNTASMQGPKLFCAFKIKKDPKSYDLEPFLVREAGLEPARA